MTQPPTWSDCIDLLLSLSLRRLSAAIITQTLTQKLMNLVHYTIVVSIACSSTMSAFRLKIPVRINIWTGTRWCSNFFLNELIYEVRLTSFTSRSNLWRLKCVWIFSNKKSMSVLYRDGFCQWLLLPEEAILFHWKMFIQKKMYKVQAPLIYHRKSCSSTVKNFSCRS